VRRALERIATSAPTVRGDGSAENDLMFLERWEMAPAPGAGAALRVAQIRRANPRLAAEIRDELRRGRPLTEPERDALAAPAAQDV
jgi:hypothetical protein